MTTEDLINETFKESIETRARVDWLIDKIVRGETLTIDETEFLEQVASNRKRILWNTK